MRRPGYLRSNNMTPKFKFSLGETPSGVIPANSTKSEITSRVANLEPGGDGANLPSDSINDQAQAIQKDLARYKPWTDSCSMVGIMTGYCLSSWTKHKSACYDGGTDNCVAWDTYENLNSRLQTLLTNHPLSAPEIKIGIKAQVTTSPNAPPLPTLIPPSGTGPLDVSFFSAFQPYIIQAQYSALATGIPAYLSVLQGATTTGDAKGKPYTSTITLLNQLDAGLKSTTDGNINPNIAPLFEMMRASILNENRPGSVDPSGGPEAGDVPPPVAGDIKNICPSQIKQTANAKYPNICNSITGCFIPGIEALASVSLDKNDPCYGFGLSNSSKWALSHWKILAASGGVIVSIGVFFLLKKVLAATTFGVLRQRKLNRKKH